MDFEDDADFRAKGPGQASPEQARNERRPGYRVKTEQSPEKAAQVVAPLQGFFRFQNATQGGVRVRRGLALGWLVQGLWPSDRSARSTCVTILQP